jgi:hypothetical protein
MKNSSNQSKKYIRKKQSELISFVLNKRTEVRTPRLHKTLEGKTLLMKQDVLA